MKQYHFENRNYVIYGLQDPNDKLIKYIGCTCRKLNNRLLSHYSSKSNQEKKDWLFLLKNNGLRPIIKNIFSITGTQETAWKEEIFFIDTFRKIGHPLLNKNDGGAGNTNLTFSEESKKKMSDSQKANHLKDSTKLELLWEKTRNRKHSEEETRLRANKLKEHYKNNPEKAIQQRDRMRGVVSNEDYRKILLVNVKKACDSRKVPILQYDFNNNFIKKHESAASAARELMCSQQNISSCAHGKKGRKTTMGFIWKLEKDVINNTVK